MTRDFRFDLNLPPGRGAGPPPAAAGSARDCGPGHGGDVGALGQAISGCLFSAGLDLDFALSVDGDGPSSGRLRHAVAELDEAVNDLRHLMLAVTGPAAGAAPDGLFRDPGARAG